jgi:hypothetical protein
MKWGVYLVSTKPSIRPLSQKSFYTLDMDVTHVLVMKEQYPLDPTQNFLCTCEETLCVGKNK